MQMAVVRLPMRVAVTVLVPVAVLLLAQVLERELADALAAGPALEEQLRVDPTERRADQRPAAEPADPIPQPLPGRVVDPVRLVEHDEIGDAQVPRDLGVPFQGGVELGRVDDLDEPAVHAALVLTGEHHPDEFLRLGEPARLDDDDIEAGVGAGEPVQEDVELARVDGTAQTAVPEGHGGVPELPGHGHGVDLDGPEVVDDDADTGATARAEKVVEQGGLAGSQEAREDDDGHGFAGHGGRA